MVEGEDFIEEKQAGVGDVEFVRSGGGEFLDLTDDVVAEESDCAGGEGRQTGNVRGGVSAECFAQDGEDVALEVDDALALGDGYLAAAGDDALIGIESDEGVSADFLAVFDGFEEEALGGLPSGAEEGGDRSFEVSDEGAEDGDEGVILREGEEIFASGLECVLGCHLSASVNGGVGDRLSGRSGTYSQGFTSWIPQCSKSGVLRVARAAPFAKAMAAISASISRIGRPICWRESRIRL